MDQDSIGRSNGSEGRAGQWCLPALPSPGGKCGSNPDSSGHPQVNGNRRLARKARPVRRDSQAPEGWRTGRQRVGEGSARSAAVGGQVGDGNFRPAREILGSWPWDCPDCLWTCWSPRHRWISNRMNVGSSGSPGIILFATLRWPLSMDSIPCFGLPPLHSRRKSEHLPLGLQPRLERGIGQILHGDVPGLRQRRRDARTLSDQHPGGLDPQ